MFDYYSPITINAGQVPSAQTDFPILISATDARFKSIANGGHCKTPFDIRPYSDSGLTTPITGYELERYNASTGELIMWVKRSSVVDGLVTYLGYGDSSLITDGSSTATWSNHFIGVYHVKDGTTLSTSDSTSNGTNLSNINTVTAAAGFIDGCGSFASASSQSLEDSAGQFDTIAQTCSAWVKATTISGVEHAVFGRGSGGSERMVLAIKSTGKLRCKIVASAPTPFLTYDGTGSHTLLTGTWYYLTLTYDSSSGLIGYVNGASDGSVSPSGAVTVLGVSTYIGGIRSVGSYWNGLIDEARYSNVARSADWISVEYNEGFPSTFETLGAEVSTTPVPPPTPTPEPIITVPEYISPRAGGSRWKHLLLEEKLWKDRQDELFLKMQNSDGLDTVRVLTEFLTRQ